MQETRVRFAPSNTGALHIGGARTAVYNYLFARRTGGKFLLRIEDTDKKRSSDIYTDQILRSMEWLGLKWDEQIYFQSGNIDSHKAAAEKMLSSGKAYRCFCPPEEFNKKRELAQKEGKNYLYDKTCRHLSADEIQRNLNEGKKFAVRIKVPETGFTEFKDSVYGKIRVANSEIDDFIILRRDGTPIYHLAVVVDDINMGITHVIRGEDHISNTPKQLLIYQALDSAPPSYAHLPMILGPDGKRLSKRHGATGVDEYREMGYLPEALLNYIALLGWNPGDEREYMTLEQLIESFSLERVNKKSAVFDFKKMDWLSSQHFTNKSSDELYEPVVEVLKEAGIIDRVENPEYLQKVIDLLKSRARTFRNFAEWGGYFFHDPQEYDEATLRKRWKSETPQYLKYYLEQSDNLPEYRAENIEVNLRKCAESLGISPGKLIHPIRLAISGFGVGPSLFHLMETLGEETVRRRIQIALEKLSR